MFLRIDRVNFSLDFLDFYSIWKGKWSSHRMSINKFTRTTQDPFPLAKLAIIYLIVQHIRQTVRPPLNCDAKYRVRFEWEIKRYDVTFQLNLLISKLFCSHTKKDRVYEEKCLGSESTTATLNLIAPSPSPMPSPSVNLPLSTIG